MNYQALAAALVLSGLATSASPATNACDQIRQACRKAGYHDTGRPGVDACFSAIVYSAAPPKGPPLPVVGAKLRAECRASLEKTPAAAPSAATPSNTSETSTPSTRLPTAVAPHNPPPTNPGPGPEAPNR
jgi:hypothetical protein